MTAVIVTLAACGAKDRTVSYVTNAENAIASLQYDNAVAFAEQALAEGEQPREALRLKGIACLKNARYEDAVQAFREALAMSDGIVTDMDYDINLYLASACMGMGDFDGAVAAYDHILALKPSDVASLYARGAALLQDGKLSEATKDFDRACDIAPRDFALRVEIYRAYAQAGYEDAGKAVMSEAFHTYEAAMSHYEKGMFAFYMGNNAEAQSYLEKAMTSVRGSEKAQVALLLGQTGEKQGDLGYAISVYSAALEEGVQLGALYNRRGMCYMAQAEYKNAVSDFEQGIALGETATHQALLRNEIAAYEYAGDFKKASELMEEYAALYPDDAEAAREAVFLRTR